METKLTVLHAVVKEAVDKKRNGYLKCMFRLADNRRNTDDRA